MTTTDVRGITEVITAEYDLTRRGSVGDKGYYEYTDDYFTLGEGGDVIMHDHVHGYYIEEVIEVRDDGARVVRWVRNKTGSTSMTDGKPDGASTPFDFGEGHALDVCFEDDFDVLPIDSSSFPSDLTGMHMLEHCIHSGTFSFFASRRHGNIDRLRQIGDTAEMGLSGAEPSLEFGGFIEIRMRRGNSVVSFDGVSAIDGRPAALASFILPQSFPFLNGGRGRGDATVRAWIALDDGAILRGLMEQVNHIVLPIGPNGSNVPMNQIVRGHLRSIAPEAYPS